MTNTMSKLPEGLISVWPDANRKLETCLLEASILQYRPSIPANSAFIVVFGLIMIVHVLQGMKTYSWGPMASMVCGCVLEIVGYVGRILLHSNHFIFSGFVMHANRYIQEPAPFIRLQYLEVLISSVAVCITLAPVFYCSAIYVVLSKCKCPRSLQKD
jgi:hypothetical protein